MGKKLRLSKSHAESLSRALNDQSRHALGGGGHPTGAAPPPLPPPPQQLIDAQAHYYILYLHSCYTIYIAMPYMYSSTQRYAALYSIYVPHDTLRSTPLALRAGADGLWLPAVAQPREPLLVNRERKRVHHPMRGVPLNPPALCAVTRSKRAGRCHSTVVG